MGGPTNHLLSNDLATDIGQGRGSATLAQSLKRTAFQNGGDPDKALSLAFKRVRLLCDNLGLQRKHYDTACELYKEVSDARVVKGRPIASVVPAIVYIACKREQNPSERWLPFCTVMQSSARCKRFGRMTRLRLPLSIACPMCRGTVLQVLTAMPRQEPSRRSSP